MKMIYVNIQITVVQECTNPGRQFAVATKLCKVAFINCGSSVLHVIFSAPRILRWLTDFVKNGQLILAKKKTLKFICLKMKVHKSVKKITRLDHILN